MICADADTHEALVAAMGANEMEVASEAVSAFNADDTLPITFEAET